MDKKSKEYKVWIRIKYNCYNPNSATYNNYSSSGINVCKQWLNSFEIFLDDMGKAPSKNHIFVRIDNTLDFTPENCKWICFGNTYITGKSVSYICINDAPNNLTILVPFDTTMINDVDNYSWYFHRKNKVATYVRARNHGVKDKSILLHHIILPLKKGYLTDHINGDGLDNRACNLRYSTHETNGINRHKINAKSGYQGVYLHKATNKWAAQIGDRNKKHIGLFSTKEEAVTAYRDTAREIYGDFTPSYWQ